jgi:hypothetical protein
VLVLDIDLLFNADIRTRFAGDAQYALMRRPKKCSLSKRILGGVVYASSSPIGRLFLNQICEHIERFLGSGTYWYCFDQYALYRAFLYMKSKTKLNGFSELTSKDVSLTLALNALILYPKGTAKDEGEFAALAGEFN